MLDVIIALIPALFIAVYSYGWRSLTLTLISVASCITFELFFQLLMKRQPRVYDLSAAVTGILLAFNLPVHTPYWMIMIGAFFAIVIVKQLYGGIGKNFLNPALAGRMFLLSWSSVINVYSDPLTHSAAAGENASILNQILSQIKEVDLVNGVPDIVTTVTPLAQLKIAQAGGAAPNVDIFNLLIGNVPGTIGAISAFMLVMGGLYLLLRGVINPRIPFAFIGTVALLTFLFPTGNAVNWMLWHTLSGSVLLGAFFMATDYSTSPVTRGGQWIFGIGCGLITVLIRYFGPYPDGVGFSILIMNCTVWLLDKVNHRRFGVRLRDIFKRKKEEAK